jgi:anti-sigma regulatory factor (Ser/Thr protein kinase)
MENSSIVMLPHPLGTPLSIGRRPVEERTADVRLDLPADPQSVGVVRAVVASVASRLALSYDSVDDLRIAAAEACSFLLTRADGRGRLRVELSPDTVALQLVIWVEGGGDTASGDRDGLSWRVIEGLADHVAEIEVDGDPAIELRMRTVHE